MISDPISRLFQISKNNPKQIAISENNRNINYRDFFKLCYLVSQNISTKIPETTPKILVFASSTIEAYSAIFGTLMSGGFYSPVNFASPDITVLNILKSYSPHLILTSTDLSARIKELLIKVGDQITVLEIDSLLEKVVTSEIIINEDNIDFEIDYPKYENNTRKLAYVIFTSGSTGIPKGVMISRYALSHYIDWAISVFKPEIEDRWAQYANIAFDLSVLDIFGSICSGATLFPVNSSVDKMLFGKFLYRNKITIVNIVPSVTDLLINSKQLNKKNIKKVRLVNFCGETLLQYQIESFFNVNPKLIIHNTYGPTECTVSCTLLRLNKNNYKGYCLDSVALGEAIEGMEIKLINAKETVGEIILSGNQVAEGYWQDQTANQSFAIKRSNGKEIRTFRTGDWARPINNNLYFSGRKDDQIKIKGYRIELGSINAQIRELVNLNVSTLFHNKMLHCFFESNESKKIDLAAIRKKLSIELINYEMPNKLYSINKIPKNNNNKIDYISLKYLIEKYSINQESLIYI